MVALSSGAQEAPARRSLTLAKPASDKLDLDQAKSNWRFNVCLKRSQSHAQASAAPESGWVKGCTSEVLRSFLPGRGRPDLTWILPYADWPVTRRSVKSLSASNRRMLAAPAEGLHEIRKKGRLRVAVYKDFPPFSDNAKGIDVDLACRFG
jgi:hypothetical protein